MTTVHHPIARLRALAGTSPHAVERCDFCGAPLEDGHDHVLDAQGGAPRCACRACALLFPPEGTGRFRRGAQPRRLAAPLCSEEQWRALGVPVGLAWFFRDGHDGRLRAQYPGAAGPVEAPPSFATQADGIEALERLSPGTEAILVRRERGHDDCWRVPMDTCWQLAGLLRRHWQGFDGGDAVRAQLDGLFASLDVTPSHAGA